MSESERIEYLIKVLESGNAAEFAMSIGASTATVTRMRNGSIGIRLRINDILAAYPSINRYWLETGEGYPGDLTIDLVKSHYEERISRADKIIDHLTRRIEELELVLQNSTKR